MRYLQARAWPGPGSDVLPMRHPYFEGPKVQKKQLPPRSHRVESLEGRQVSTLVCRTYGWDPQNRTYRAATGPQKKCSTLFFPSVLVEMEIAPGAPQSCQSACLYPGECVMRDLQARAGPGPGRVPTCYLCDTPTLRDLKFKKQLNPRSHRAESLEERQVSTLVCRTNGWDPQNRTYRAATGPRKKVLDT